MKRQGGRTTRDRLGHGQRCHLTVVNLLERRKPRRVRCGAAVRRAHPRVHHPRIHRGGRHGRSRARSHDDRLEPRRSLPRAAPPPPPPAHRPRTHRVLQHQQRGERGAHQQVVCGYERGHESPEESNRRYPRRHVARERRRRGDRRHRHHVHTLLRGPPKPLDEPALGRRLPILGVVILRRRLGGGCFGMLPKFMNHEDVIRAHSQHDEHPQEVEHPNPRHPERVHVHELRDDEGRDDGGHPPERQKRRPRMKPHKEKRRREGPCCPPQVPPQILASHELERPHLSPRRGHVAITPRLDDRASHLLRPQRRRGVPRRSLLRQPERQPGHLSHSPRVAAHSSLPEAPIRE